MTARGVARVVAAAVAALFVVGVAAVAGAAAAQPGRVLRTSPSNGPLGAVAEMRLLTLQTRDSTGRARVIDATLFRPRAPWTGPGARPLVGVAVGTHGQGDQCAPSKAFRRPVIAEHGSAQVGYENSSVALLVARGYAVVVTDYLGLGRPGMHTYLNRTDHARALLDAVRAARTVIGTSGPVGLWGYSQGGAAAAAAAEVAPGYAPELPLRAVYAGAPPADVAATLRGPENVLTSALAGWSANSAMATEPELRAPISAVLNANGRDYLRRAARMCMPDAVLVSMVDSSSYTADGRSLVDALLSVPGFARWAERQRLGTVAPRVPALVHGGRHDDVVPFAVQTRLVRDWRDRGARVELQVFESPPTSPGLGMDHSSPHQVDNERPLAWLDEQLLR